MTESVILISDKPFNLAAFGKACEANGRAYLQSDRRLVVEGDWGWFALDCDQSLRADFDDEELAMLGRLIREPIFGQLSYRPNHAADMAIKLLPLGDSVLVDNDHGLVLPVGEVRQRIQSGCEWQTVFV
jgi:hypothetical protein